MAAAGALVVTVVAAQALWMGRAIWGLNLGLLVAYAVWASRPPLSAAARRRVAPLFEAGIAVMLAHFAEEYRFGFRTAFPGLLGVEPWSPARFAAFNASWLAAFGLAAFALRRGARLAELLVWFFALLAATVNGLSHIGIALARGAYFPGLVTAPLLVVIGALLLSRLVPAPAAGDGSGAP